jgi:uncharacterized membrane protein HdeD (DUF308 family)
MSTMTTSSCSIESSGRWKWFLALATLLFLLGIASAGAAAFLELTSVLLFGPLLLTSSIMQLVMAMFAEKRETLLHFAAACAELVLGLVIMAWPPQNVVRLITLVAFCLVVIGLTRLAHSLAVHSRHQGWMSVTGAVALLLGILVGVCQWLHLPVRGTSLIAICLAVDFLCHGASWAAAALIERTPVEATD